MSAILFQKKPDTVYRVLFEINNYFKYTSKLFSLLSSIVALSLSW
jgi:hypothetical protein